MTGIEMAVLGAVLYLIGAIGVGNILGKLIHDSERERL